MMPDPVLAGESSPTALRYALNADGPYQEVPLVEGRPCLPVEFPYDPKDASVHGAFVVVPGEDVGSVTDAPWVRAAAQESAAGGTRFRLLIRPSEAGQPGTYVSRLLLGGRELAVVLQLRPTAPVLTRTPRPAPGPATAPSRSIQPASTASEPKSWKPVGIAGIVIVMLGLLFSFAVVGQVDSGRTQETGGTEVSLAQSQSDTVGFPSATDPPPAGIPEPVAAVAPPATRPAGAHAGKVLLASDFGAQRGQNRLFLMDPSTGSFSRLTSGTYDDIPSVSPDHLRLVYESKVGKDLDLLWGDLNGPYAPLANETATEAMPAWSPDGRTICYQSNRAGSVDLYLFDVESRKVRRLTSDPANERMPNWTPDGQHIVFTSNRTGKKQWQLYRIPADGGEMVRLTNSGAADDTPTHSRDGKNIAFVSNRSGACNIHIMPAGGGPARQITHVTGSQIACAPSWSRDGDELMYSSNHSGSFQIYVKNLSSGAVRKLTSGSANFTSPLWLW